MRRFASALLTILFVVSAINIMPVGAAQVDGDVEISGMSQPMYEAYNETAVSALDINELGLKDYLYKELAKCTRQIDISSYRIPYSEENITAVYNMIFYDMTETFHVIYVSGYHNNSIITKIGVNYACSASEYSSMLSQVNAVAEKMVADIRNSDLSDAEKALLIHDRLALHCTYDYEYSTNDTSMFESSGIYGALVEGQAICQGYARAYKHLLKMTGVESYLCTSDELNHMWNIVYIDSQPYHVDVTWDDPAANDVMYNPAGRVNHYYFLQSTDAFISGGHDASDYDTSPSDTTYDSFCWQNSITAFQYLNGRIYYVDKAKEMLVCLDTGEEILDVEHNWRASAASIWASNFTSLSSDGENLLYSDSNSIYSYDVETSEIKTIHTTELSEGDYFYIFGFMYSDGYLVYDVTNNPNFNDTDNIIRYSVLYDTIAPNAFIETTNHMATAQTLKLSFSDNVGITGYYFGKSENYSDNKYVETSDLTAYTEVSDGCTYYLTVADVAGNLSETYVVTFCKTTLDATGGTVTPEYIVSAKGLTVSLPTPEKEGYNFLGWAITDEDTKDLFYEVTPTESSVYYAHWQEEPVVLEKVEFNSLPEKTEYFEGDALDTSGLSLKLIYSNGTSDIIDSGFTASGFSSDSVGEQTVLVTYGDFTLSFTVRVSEVATVKMSVKTCPLKTEYFIGNTIDATGLTLLLEYNNGTEEIIDSGYILSGYDFSTAGSKTVNVSYGGFTDSFQVTVKEPTLVDIKVHSLPDKTVYTVGESLDLKGLELLAIYDSGDTHIISQEFSGSDLVFSEAGKAEITLTVNGIDVSFTVNVKEPGVPATTQVSSTADITETQPATNVTIVQTDATAPEEITDSIEVTEPADTTSAVATESQVVSDPTEESSFASHTTEPSESTSVDASSSVIQPSSTPDEQYLKGDVNLDGKVNIKDATAIQKFLAKMIELEENSQKAADVNNDAKINVKDVTTIQKFVAGIIKEFI